MPQQTSTKMVPNLFTKFNLKCLTIKVKKPKRKRSSINEEGPIHIERVDSNDFKLDNIQTLGLSN